MNNEIKNKLKHFGERYPGWETDVVQYLENDYLPDDESVIDDFLDLADQICNAVKEDECEIHTAVELFEEDLQPHIKKLLESRLRPYRAFALIREREAEQRNQLEDLIDDIWQQNIIRRNPAYSVGPDLKIRLAVTDEALNEFIINLNAVVDHCISRLLNYDGMLYVLSTQTGISQESGEYIARKIERDYEELRTNYVIKRLTNLFY